VSVFDCDDGAGVGVAVAAGPGVSVAAAFSGIFTRRGCNSTACHGSVKGRGGFKLSSSAALFR